MYKRRHADLSNIVDFVHRRSSPLQGSIACLLFGIIAILSIADRYYHFPYVISIGISGSLIGVLPYCFYAVVSSRRSLSGAEFQNSVLANSLKSVAQFYIVIDINGRIVCNFNFADGGLGSSIFSEMNAKTAELLQDAIDKSNAINFKLSDHDPVLNFYPLDRPAGYFVILALHNVFNYHYKRLFDAHGIGYYCEDDSGLIIDSNQVFQDISEGEHVRNANSIVELLQGAKRDDGFICCVHLTREVYPFAGEISKFHSLVSIDVFTVRGTLGDMLMPICQVDNNGQIIDCNDAFVNRLGGAKSIASISDAFSSFPLDVGLVEELKVKGGDYFRVYVSKHRMGATLFWFDIGDKKAMESDLLHSQKVDSLGKFAGGIAHDFNNILTVILSFCDLLSECITPGDESYPYVMQIKQNVDRAADLVQQILAFSRKQVFREQVFDMNELISGLFDMVNRIIGEGISLKVGYGTHLWNVKADRGQIEQVIINLVVNAKAAMDPKGGKLDIGTENCVIGGDTVQFDVNNSKITEGSYVKIYVRDNGQGIPPKVAEKIFEPFFTTKVEGTGLGLSTVHGIVAQSGGYLSLSSQEGVGSEFVIWLPRISGVAAYNIDEIGCLENKQDEVEEDLGRKAILVVEDEALISSVIKKSLSDRGYSVIVANSGKEAREAVDSYSSIDIILSDIILSDYSGVEVVEYAKLSFPEIRVLYMSGYSRQELDNVISHDYRFLAKPFGMSDLLATLRDQG